MAAANQKTLLVLSQVYIPDPAAVGQYMHDAAVEITKRGYHTRVYTAASGYDEPDVRFPPRECIDGVEVIRLPFSSFGKRSILVRVIAQMSFLLQTILRGLLTPRLGVILVSTSPPMCSAAALVIAAIRRVPIVYWVMDVNPDQAVSLGAVREGSLLVRAFNVLNRAVLARAHRIVTLDRFMAERLMRKRDVSRTLDVFPPWPLEDHLRIIPHEENTFRRRHRLDGKFVVMYSGNHVKSNPIATVITAAERLQHREDIVFLFIGGGTHKRDVSAAINRGARNIRELPYQPLSELAHSLSAADMHIATVGDTLVGIVHPCKIYGAMAVARPILLIGPNPCHASDLMLEHDIGRHVRHGDIDGTVRAITELAAMPAAERAAIGRRAREVVRSKLSKGVLCTRFGDIIEETLRGRKRLYDLSVEIDRQRAGKKAA